MLKVLDQIRQDCIKSVIKFKAILQTFYIPILIKSTLKTKV